MRRRDFLQWTGLGGAALGLGPALAAEAFSASPGSALVGDSFQLTIFGLENAERARDFSLELAHPIQDVVLWAHQGGSAPSTGRTVTHTVPVDAAASLTLFVTTSDRVRRPVSFRSLECGRYRIAVDRDTQLLFGVEESCDV